MIEAVEKLVGCLNTPGRMTMFNDISYDDNHDWGYQIKIINSELYCIKFLVLTNFERGSWHKHSIKDESWLILEGDLNVIWESNRITTTYGAGFACRIEPNTPHQIWAKSLPCVILEVSTHDDDSDIVYVDEEQKGDK